MKWTRRGHRRCARRAGLEARHRSLLISSICKEWKCGGGRCSTYGQPYHDAFVHRRCRRPARAEPNGNSSTGVSVHLLVPLFYSPRILFDSPRRCSQNGFCLSPRRSFRPLFVNVYETATSMLRPRKPTAFLLSGCAPGRRVSTFWSCLSSFTDR